MSFITGRVSFCRFLVSGDAPASADEAAIAILQEHSFVESNIVGPDQVDSGFVTGQHLFDTQFSYEKNGFGHLMLFALRIDTHKVPGSIKQAYRKLHEQAAAEVNPTGLASRGEKRTAADEAARQISEELATGRFRASKLAPIIWDLKQKRLYCGASGITAIEELTRLMRDSFSVELAYQSSGVAAGMLLQDQGRHRDYEDIKPSRFTNPPATATAHADDADGPGDMTIPVVPWVARSVDVKDFLGNEFFMWLWWLIETQEGTIQLGQTDELFVAMDKLLDMDCAWDAGGKLTLRGHGPTRLIEAGDALVTGKWPRKIRLLLSDGEHHWELTLQGDNMAISSAVLPQIEDVKSPREIIEQRLELITTLANRLDQLYAKFLMTRTSSAWPSQRKAIGQWITDRLGPATAQAMRPAAQSIADDVREEVLAV